MTPVGQVVNQALQRAGYGGAASPIELRPYQREALAAVRSRYDAGVRRMLLVAATGAGKTVTFSHLGEALGLGPADKTLILAHRDELVHQARAKYLASNPNDLVGIEKAENRATPMDRVAVGSVQTLRGRRVEDFLRRFGRPRLVVTDEAHHAASDSYQALYRALGISREGDVVHVGVTATPKRSDGVGLDGTFDVIAHSIGIDELIEQGYLVPIRGYVMHTSTNLDAVRTLAGDFNATDLSDAVDTDERNARVVSAFADLCPGRKAIVFASSVAHSQNLRDAFKAVGFNALHVDGAMPMDERRDVLKKFGSGGAQILTNCQVATEGYDEPSVDCVVIARPTKSPVLMVQMVGRCTRLFAGKTDAVVIDMVDVTRRHSVVTLPSLFGMPGNFDLEGKSVTAAAAKYREVVSESPEMAGLLGSSGDLDASEKISARERFHARLKALMADARSSQSYVDVNLLRPPELEPHLKGATSLNWIPTADDSYLLRVENDSIRIHADLLGDHSVVITRSKDGQTAKRELGTFDSAETAFAIADDWVRRNHAERLVLVDRGARWREAPASDKQVAALARFRIAAPEKLTKGKAAELLDVLIASSSRRKSA